MTTKTRNKPTGKNAIKFLAKNPTFIGRVRETDLFECPTYGDERQLWAITKDGRLRRSGHYEMPSHHDAADLENL